MYLYFVEIKNLIFKKQLFHFWQENDFDQSDITEDKWIGNGSFGKVFSGTLKMGEEIVDIALKKPWGMFSMQDASDIKLEHMNMR